MTFFLLLACATDELSQNWQLDRTRILAAQAEPPEAKPGDVVQFRSLVFSPEPIESVVWFAPAGLDFEWRVSSAGLRTDDVPRDGHPHLAAC